MKISTVAQMRVLDQTAIKEYGIPGELLMENAGLAVYYVLRDQFGIQGKKFLIVCGIGNNGGDGCVVARLLHSNGGQVKVLIVGDPARYKDAAKINYKILNNLPIEILRSDSSTDFDGHLMSTDLVVDAIFGTGLVREVSGIYRDIIMAINNSKKPVLSVDIPSGVNGDTGEITGVAVKADFTVTFGLPKIGNMLYPGYGLCGKLFVSHISFPRSIYSSDSIAIEINEPFSLPPRLADGHKGTFGQVLFIAGASSYFGAPYFAALSFLKAGGGYSRLATPGSVAPYIANKGSEIVMVPQPETGSGSLSLEGLDNLLALAEKMDMVVIGPGMSLEPETQQLARKLIANIDRPILVDGDGITAACQNLQLIRNRSAETILTPHVGEMTRITGLRVDELNPRKVDVLQDTAQDLNATIVLKGAHSLIGYPDRRVYINMSGNSGMASAGSGDVLTGTIAGMYGLGLGLQASVRQGTFIHGLAGDLAANEIGQDGITAQDILDYLPTAVKIARQGLSSELEEQYLGPCVI